MAQVFIKSKQKAALQLGSARGFFPLSSLAGLLWLHAGLVLILFDHIWI